MKIDLLERFSVTFQIVINGRKLIQTHFSIFKGYIQRKRWIVSLEPVLQYTVVIAEIVPPINEKVSLYPKLKWISPREKDFFIRKEKI